VTYSSGIPPETIPLNAAFKKTYYQMWPESNGPEPKPKIKQGQDAFDDPDWLAWKAEDEKRKDLVSRVLLEAIIQERITVCVQEKTGGRDRILPGEFKKTYWPERIFLSDEENLPGEIHPFSDDALYKYKGAVPFVTDLDFDNFLESEPLLPPKMNKTGSSGRPSIMKAVLAELERRIEAGELSAGLTPQARDLEDWVGKTFPRYQRPKAASIRNSIRKRFRAATQ
jgi:hypothetical protein